MGMIDVAVDDRRGIRTVTLDRPEARNALTPGALADIQEAIDDADESVIAVQGAGSAFSAGADLDVVAALDRDEAADFAALGQRVARTLETADAIVVACIDGPALGGGLELALACDVRVATPASTFGEPGVTFGLFGAWGGTVRLPRVVGEGDALELALSGRTIDAETALGMGLISRIDADPLDVVEEVAENPPATLSVLKSRLRDDDDRETQERREADAFAELVDVHGQRLRELRE